ncbi:MAG: SDR family NAD(P)-dependent oxidoreductase [Kiritimatiellia bacterium]|nr:SDR family oxidoreductase [Lentisphaerota bacterium]
MSLFDMQGKTVVVVGGAGYLALPACVLLAEHGATVVVADRNREQLGKAEAAVRQALPGARVSSLFVDVADEASINRLVEDTLSVHGRLDGMVNASCAAIGKRLEDLQADEFEQANRVNITGFFLLSRRAAEAMPDGGSIVMISSMYGIVAPDPRMYHAPMLPNPIEYGTAKAGILQMTRYMAAHYGPRNIRVNAIAPGPFPKAWKYEGEQAFIERLADRTMLGRVGRQNEIAGAVAFLVSDASTFVTGHCLRVDGGWTQW